MKNKQTHTNFTERCAKKLIHLGEVHCESKSILFSFYEPKLSSKLKNEIDKKL